MESKGPHEYDFAGDPRVPGFVLCTRFVLCSVRQEVCQVEVEASEEIAGRTQKRELMTDFPLLSLL